MSKLTGLLDPEGRATFDAMMAPAAARGKCNPDDPSPCVDGDPGRTPAPTNAPWPNANTTP